MSLNPYLALRNLARYQFGIKAGDALFRDDLVKDMKIKYSKKTGRIRYVFLKDKPYFSVRTSDGFLTLSIPAARVLLESLESSELFVVVYNQFRDHILSRKEVLVRHIKSVDPRLKSGCEVIVIDEDRKLIGVGRAILNGDEMLEIKRGIAIKLRKVVRNV